MVELFKHHLDGLLKINHQSHPVTAFRVEIGPQAGSCNLYIPLFGLPGLQILDELSNRLQQKGVILVTESQDLNTPVPGNFSLVGAEFFQHCVKVASPETERTHSGPPGAFSRCQPRPQTATDIKRGSVDLELGVHLVGLQGRENNLVMEGQGRLDQAGATGCRLGVTYIGFYRSESAFFAALVCVLTENPAQGFEFNLIADPGSRSVGLDHPDRGRLYSSLLVSSCKGLDLAFFARGVYPVGLSVTGGTESLDDGVNPVPVIQGVFQALQNQQADTFAEDRSISLGGKGAGVAAF